MEERNRLEIKKKEKSLIETNQTFEEFCLQSFVSTPLFFSLFSFLVLSFFIKSSFGWLVLCVLSFSFFVFNYNPSNQPKKRK